MEYIKNIKEIYKKCNLKIIIIVETKVIGKYPFKDTLNSRQKKKSCFAVEKGFLLIL